MNKEENNIENFLKEFNQKDQPLISEMIRMGLINKVALRNYAIVLELKRLQFVEGKTYTKSISILAKEYGFGKRNIRHIYDKYRLFVKIN